MCFSLKLYPNLQSRTSCWLFKQLLIMLNPFIKQPHSQGSLLPALSFRRAGRREPWERGCLLSSISWMAPSYACQTSTFHQQAYFVRNNLCICTLCAWVIGTRSKLPRRSQLRRLEVKSPKNEAVCMLGNDLSMYSQILQHEDLSCGIVATT